MDVHRDKKNGKRSVLFAAEGFPSGVGRITGDSRQCSKWKKKERKKERKD